MRVRVIWEFDADVEDIDNKSVDIEGLAIDLTKRELDYQINAGDIKADDFMYEIEK